MPKRLDVHDIRQFDEEGIRKIRKEGYQFKEGTIRHGTGSEDFYLERAKKLYIHEGVDRIILLSRQVHEESLEDLAKKIMEKSSNEWRRSPDDWLIKETEYTFEDSIEIIELKGKTIDIDIRQINLVSNLYYTARHYLAKIHGNPNELSEYLCRLLAGLYPEEWKKELPEGIPHYDPKDVLGILASLTLDRALIAYFKFFREFFIKKSWDIEEIVEELETLLNTPTSFHTGLNDLHFVLRIIHRSLSLESLSEIIGLKHDIDNYFLTIASPEPYTDMLFRKFLQLFDFLQEFQQQGDLQDKLYFLEESRKKIRESEALVADNFVEPFREFYLDILRKWMDFTFGEGGKLLGRASLKTKLQTKKVALKEELMISLNIKNVGIGAAENIEVVLLESPEYEICGQDHQVINVLQRNRDADIEFQIRPQKKENISLSFSIFYGGSNQIDFSDVLIFVEREEFSRIPNPYNFTKPAEKNMFFGREDLFEWIESNMKGPVIYQNVLIMGQRRAGKTSFLRQLKNNTNSDDYCIFIDFELFPHVNDVGFLYEVCQELHRTIPNGISPPNPQEFAKKSYMAFGDYIRNFLSNSPDSKKIILIFDEFDKVESKIRDNLFKPGFLLFLRGFFQHSARVSAIIGGNFDFTKLNSPEWKEFFTIFNPKKIGVLDEDSATVLITQPVKEFLQYDTYAIKKILDFSGQNPFYIQLICHTLINCLNEEKKQNFVEAGDVSAVVLGEVKEKADLVLKLAWGELDEMEKNVLFGLSRLRNQYRRSIELKELEKHLKQNNIKVKRGRLFIVLSVLREKEILKKVGESPSYYDFSIPLFGEWISDHGKFSR